jgi:hypothetical protein
VPGVELVAVSARDLARAAQFAATLPHPVKVLGIEALEPEADVVIECAPAAVLGEIIGPFRHARKQAIVLSVGALLSRPDLIDLARQTGGSIVVPTGALIGLDAMLAAAEGTIYSVRMVTRKPPGGLVGAPHLVDNQISIEGLTEPKRVFTGTAREAANLGRSHCDAEHSYDLGRCRLRAFHHDDRKHSVGKPEDRANRGPERHCAASQDERHAQSRHLRSRREAGKACTASAYCLCAGGMCEPAVLAVRARCAGAAQARP